MNAVVFGGESLCTYKGTAVELLGDLTQDAIDILKVGENAVLIVHGEKAHSRYMGEDSFIGMTGHIFETNNAPAPYTGNAPVGETRDGNKELLIVEGASHCDLYDQKDIIPFDKIESFIRENIEA